MESTYMIQSPSMMKGAVESSSSLMKTTESPTSPNNKGLCYVCKDKASGTHYRVQTCEGCKGFWRRTIQRGSGQLYKCRTGLEMCTVNVDNRGRCQKCRYIACVRSGMVADLVMSDKERLSRIRLVDQNRERRRGPQDQPTDQDTNLFNTLNLVASNLFMNTAQISEEWSRCVKFVSGVYRGLGEVEGGEASCHQELLYTRTAYIMQPNQLQAFPPLAKLSRHLRAVELDEEGLLVILLLVSTRPRLSWPANRSQQLAAVWEAVSGAVRRRFGTTGAGETGRKLRYGDLLQIVHMAAWLQNLLNINQVLNTL